MVDEELKKIIEELEEIEKIDDKIDYLEKTIKKTKDEELKEKLSLMLNAIKFPEKENIERKFQEVEETPVYEEKAENLENLIERAPEVKKLEAEEDKNKKIEYWEVGEDLYESPGIQRGRARKEEIIFERGQLGTEDIGKYTHAMDVGENEKFIGRNMEKYKFELHSTNVFDIADRGLKKTGEIKYERRAHKGA